MISKRERKIINKSHVLKDHIMQEAFELVNYFYPGQLLTHPFKTQHICEIMNNDDYFFWEIMFEKAFEKTGKDDMDNFSVADFCDYKKIDDLLIQVCLASLKEETPAPRLQVMPTDRTRKPLRKVREAREDLRKGIIIHMPVTLYKELNPLGELMAKRDGSVLYRCIIRPYEIAQIFGIHINTARAMLRLTRTKEGMPDRSFVPIEKFCKVHYLEEKDFRKSLASIHGDKVEREY